MRMIESSLGTLPEGGGEGDSKAGDMGARAACHIGQGDVYVDAGSGL